MVDRQVFTLEEHVPVDPLEAELAQWLTWLSPRRANGKRPGRGKRPGSGSVDHVGQESAAIEPLELRRQLRGTLDRVEVERRFVICHPSSRQLLRQAVGHHCPGAPGAEDYEPFSRGTLEQSTDQSRAGVPDSRYGNRIHLDAPVPNGIHQTRVRHFAVLALLLLPGCRLFAANREISRIEASLTRIGGFVHAGEDESEPILVVAFQDREDELRAVNYEVLLDAGVYGLLLPPGRFRVFAFEDENQDFIHQSEEPIGELRGGIRLEAGDNLIGLDIQLADARIDQPPIDLSDVHDNPNLGTFRSTIGSVVSLDEKRFSKKSGVHGMWRPLSALNRERMGVFFLEPYDPCRAPVLFVHGMQGSVQDLRPLIESLDKNRFQAWFFQYPSGLRLRFLSRYLAEAIRELGVRHKPSRLHIVAHSMGGLIARSFINQNVTESKQKLIRGFITISTPFNGHKGARVGVRFSPVVAPAWIDMVPNSQFIQSIYRVPLPDYVEHHLFFTYRGGGGQTNDGVVTLKSMLDPRAQRPAAAIHGYDETHTSVLEAPEAIAEVNKLLERIDRAQGPLERCDAQEEQEPPNESKE